MKNTEGSKERYKKKIRIGKRLSIKKNANIGK